MRFFREFLLCFLCGQLFVQAANPEFLKLRDSADEVVTGKVVKIEDTGKLVEVKKGVWMVRIMCHMKVLEGSPSLSGKIVIVERFRNVTQQDRQLFDHDREYLLAMVDQPVQADLAKGVICKALLLKSAIKGLWRPAGGSLQDRSSFIVLLPSV